MGSGSGSEAEHPRHDVLLDEYYIDVTLVTNAQFLEFVETTGYRTSAEGWTDPVAESVGSARTPGTWLRFCSPQRMDHPVVCVSWHDAAAYATWAGKRLPTEAEWEKAARGGIPEALYPWGDDASGANLADRKELASPNSPVPTAAVGQSHPNAYGLFDMVGNVWQWCSDWYDETYYAKSPARNPLGPPVGKYRARRGGAWNVRELFRLRCANRGAMPPDQFWPNLGFRCVASADLRDPGRQLW
jgi:sulfatase modifying factor 1